ncbi:MAG: helix-turn-helix domain-containing protein [Gordonibacter sp.]|nr:helix-turn-helix domain-containing protein [Gordonibacter sp.]
MGSRISYRNVLRHHANGRSIREIASACLCSRSAVQDILARAEERGVGWEDVAALCDGETRKLVRGNPGGGNVSFAAIDVERIDKEMARDKTMTLMIIWEEYYASAVSRGEHPYLYSRFCEIYAAHKKEAGIKGRKNHTPWRFERIRLCRKEYGGYR